MYIYVKPAHVCVIQSSGPLRRALVRLERRRSLDQCVKRRRQSGADDAGLLCRRPILGQHHKGYPHVHLVLRKFHIDHLVGVDHRTDPGIALNLLEDAVVPTASLAQARPSAAYEKGGDEQSVDLGKGLRAKCLAAGLGRAPRGEDVKVMRAGVPAPGAREPRAEFRQQEALSRGDVGGSSLIDT